LCGILHITICELREALKSKKRYYTFYKQSGSKKRRFDPPIGLTKRIHTTIYSLLARIETPEFLFSGVKKKSYVTNAQLHKDAAFFLNMDIKGFYPNTGVDLIFNFFHKIMQKQSVDSIFLHHPAYTKSDFGRS
jgi:hypothetical protein